MSEAAPETRPGGGGGGNFLQRSPLLGVPNWLWVVLGTSVAAGGFILYRRRRNKAAAAQQQATSTQVQTACTDANNRPVDCNSLLAVNSEGQAQYEQLTSELTGISGQQAALGSTVQQLQGQLSRTAPPPHPAQTPGASPYGGLSDAAGNVYTYITSPAESHLLMQQGIQVYAQTGPNTFVPWQQAPNQGSGFPLFQKIS